MNIKFHNKNNEIYLKKKSHQLLNPGLTPTLAGDLKMEFMENWMAESQDPKTNLFRVTLGRKLRKSKNMAN